MENKLHFTSVCRKNKASVSLLKNRWIDKSYNQKGTLFELCEIYSKHALGFLEDGGTDRLDVVVADVGDDVDVDEGDCGEVDHQGKGVVAVGNLKKIQCCLYHVVKVDSL